jgi:hypothetical protein
MYVRRNFVLSIVSDEGQLKDLRTFDPYRTYLSKQDEGQKMFQDVMKKFSSFSSFIDVSEAGSNPGIRLIRAEHKVSDDRYREYRSAGAVDGAGSTNPTLHSSLAE